MEVLEHKVKKELFYHIFFILALVNHGSILNRKI